MRSVLFGLLGHQAHVGHAAHGGGVVGAVGFAVVDHRRVHAGVGAVGNDGLCGLTLALGVPHASGVTQHGGHRGVDDDIAGDVQVGDAAVGVDHGDAAEVLGHIGGEGRPRSRRGLGQHLADGVAKAVVGVHAQGRKRLAVLLKTGANHARRPWPKMIGSETFIMVAFMCSENSTPLSLARRLARRKEVNEALLMKEESTTSPASTATGARSSVAFPDSSVNVMWTVVACFGDRDRLLVAEEVAIGHAGHVAVAVGRPFPHAVGVVLGRRPSPLLGARRSELPSRSTGFTALPFTES